MAKKKEIKLKCPAPAKRLMTANIYSVNGVTGKIIEPEQEVQITIQVQITQTKRKVEKYVQQWLSEEDLIHLIKTRK